MYRISAGTTSYLVDSGSAPALVDGAAAIRESYAALSVLRRSVGEFHAMRTLRTLLADVRHADVNRLHDVEVVESLAGLVAAGRVWLAAQVTPIGESARFSIESMGPAAAAPPPPTHAASPAPRSAPTEAAEPSFRADVDAPLLAATLKDASKDGVPFCEECARAAMAA